MRNFNYRVSYATPTEDVYTTVITSTKRKLQDVMSEVTGKLYELAVANGELKEGEEFIGLSVLFVGEVCDNVTQKSEEV